MSRRLALPLALALTFMLQPHPERSPALFRGMKSKDQAASRLAPNRLVVSPTGPYLTIPAALTEAQAGDVIEVHGGVYAGPLVVDKSVTLEGNDWPVVDGGGEGTVVTLAAPEIVFRGFEVRGSGVEPDQDHAGITLTAPQITVENNHLRDVLFGIFVSQADQALVRGNTITSKDQYDEGRKGDGIRVWYSPQVILENNQVAAARDVVLWYAEDIIVRENVIERGRYGLHLMYCNGAVIEHNQILNNSVGIYTMYSKDVSLRENLVRGQRGPSGYALGFKDADNIEITDNLLVDNRVGVFLDGTPFSPEGFGRFQQNVLAFNDVGVSLLPAVQRNVIENNTFWENVEQVAVQGSGTAEANLWRNNYWSDYTGFDAEGDGQGDLPYQAESFFEGLSDREPRLRALLYSPTAQALEFAAASFPVFQPRPKLVDQTPRIQPLPLPTLFPPASNQAVPMPSVAVGLISLSTACALFAFASRGRSMKSPSALPPANLNHQRPISIRVKQLRKRYGKVDILHGLSFDVHPGEVVALWGANGAGKTTLLKALLGLISFEGQIEVEGYDVSRDGKRARRSIGYVPQETAFYDLSVKRTLEFYARLKSGKLKIPATRIPILLGRLGLREHAAKSVSVLSGGLKQRLALAIALLDDPPVLLMDEPTANLDVQARCDYLALLAALRDEGKTIVFASHRLEELEALADRVLWLEQGRLIETLKPEMLRARPTIHFERERLAVWN